VALYKQLFLVRAVWLNYKSVSLTHGFTAHELFDSKLNEAITYCSSFVHSSRTLTLLSCHKLYRNSSVRQCCFV